MPNRIVRSPEIAELRAFCTAVDLGTLGKAALALGVSQPGLSKRLRTLESAAGTELLERSRSGVVPTAVGRRLYPEAKRLLDQAEAIERLLDRAPSAKAPIRLAVSHTIAEFYLPPELVAYGANGARRPPVELAIANSSAVRRMVAGGEVPIGITAAEVAVGAPDDDLEEVDLLEDEVVVAVPQDHRWHRRDQIPKRSLLATPLVMRDPDAHDRRCAEGVLAEKGLAFAEPLVEVGSTAVAKREALQLSAPVLISALSLAEERDRLYARPVAGLRFSRRFVLICRSFSSLSREDREFVAFLQRSKRDGSA